MAKHYKATSSGLDMIRVHGPGLESESQGLNTALLNWILDLLDKAYEAGLDWGIRYPPVTPEKPIDTNPAHYKVGGIECIDYLRAKLTPEEFRGFLKGNAVKYLSRAEHKGNAEDYAKANWYTAMLTGKDPRNA